MQMQPFDIAITRIADSYLLALLKQIHALSERGMLSFNDLVITIEHMASIEDSGDDLLHKPPGFGYCFPFQLTTGLSLK
ncbi:MAG: hypothetical protein R3E39_06595 [Anaerolineae bacterium]